MEEDIEQDGHIVYAAFFENGLCAYVGSGKVGREAHLTSGVSHCYEANRHHFGKDKRLNVLILHNGLSKKESMSIEISEICRLRPIWNKYAGSPRVFAKMKKFAISRYMNYRNNILSASEDTITRDREIISQIVKHMSSEGVAVFPRGFKFVNIERNKDGMFSQIVKGRGKYYPQYYQVFEFEQYKKGVGYVVRLRNYKEFMDASEVYCD